MIKTYQMMDSKQPQRKYNIVILDGHCANPGDLSWEELKEFGQLKIYERTSQEQVVERSIDADILLVNKTKITATELQQLTQLKYIGVLATGFNHIDIEAAHKQNVVVSNIPSYSTYSVAQMVFASIFAISNRVEHYAQQTREGKWTQNPDFCYWDTPLIEVAGKTLGIVGLGHIGTKVAHIAREFGMEVYAFTSKNAVDLPEGIQKTTLDGLLSVSDILTLHCPLTPETRELINAESLKKMKQGAILINTGRGPLVNEADVAAALQSGKLAAYGADVMCQEPPAAENPLLQQPNAFITPHIAWATQEARKRLVNIAINNVRAFVQGEPINVVNK